MNPTPSPDHQTLPALQLVATRQLLPGAVLGQAQDVLEVSLKLAPLSEVPLAELDRLLAALLPQPISLRLWMPGPTSPLPALSVDQLAEQAPRQLCLIALRWALVLQLAAGHPIFAKGLVMPMAQALSLRLFLPFVHAASALAALNWAVETLSALIALGPADWQALPEGYARRAAALIESLSRRGTQDIDMRYLLRAAQAQGIPWQRVAERSSIYRLGYGARARLLSRTLTERNSGHAQVLATNKGLANTLLGQAGLPVPPHRFVANADEAVAAAERLGYPVVVKPVDLTLGMGVSAGLKDADAVRQAYALAALHQRPILVERHIVGKDYRIVVVGDQVVWALERVPGGVTGDGRQSVAQLLAALNADPLRGDSLESPLKRIELDQEAASLLAEQGLGPESVPAVGRFVLLRRKANLAQGGTPYALLDQVHPDNLRMALRALRVLGAEVGGIDYLSPDISRPWHEVGGAICEVNIRPNLGTATSPEVYDKVIAALMQGDGRIPIALQLVDSAPVAASVRLQALLRAGGLQTGLASGQGAWIGTERVGWEAGAHAANGRLLLADQQVEAAVLEWQLAALGREALPFDRCETVTVLSETWPELKAAAWLMAICRWLLVPAALADRLTALPAERLIAVADGPEAVAAHRARGGSAIWLEGTALRQVGLAEAPPGLELAQPPGDLAALLATATALALGCDLGVLSGALPLDEGLLTR